MGDLNSPSESGRKLARRTIDHAVEVCVRTCIQQWHLIAPQLENRPNGEQK